MSTLSPWVAQYVAVRLRRGEITSLTARGVRQHLTSFADSFGNRPVEQLGPRAVERWLEDMAHLRASTRGERLASLRRFARWLVDNELLPRDFMRGAPTVRRKSKVPRTAGWDTFRACLTAARTDRERCVLWLAYGLGLRCVSIARLRVEHYDPSARTLLAIGKAEREYVVPVPSRVARELDSYLDATGLRGGAFVRSEKQPEQGISASRVSCLIGQIIKRAGVKKHPYDGISAHGFRAAAGSDLLDTDPDPRVAQELLGHANLATTSVYFRSAGMRRVRDALEQRFALAD